MPPRLQKKGAGIRAIAPAIPLGIALLHGGWAPPPAPKPQGDGDRAHILAAHADQTVTHHCENVTNAQQCHTTYEEGCTNATKPNTYDAYLSYLKNLLPSPDLAQSQVAGILTSLDDFQQFDRKTIAMDLGKQKQASLANELADMGEGNFYEAVGYLYYAIPGGIETCNCKLKNLDDKDFHIGLGFDPNVARAIESGQTKNRGNDIDPVVQQTSVIVEMTPFYRDKFHPSWTLDKVQAIEGHQVKAVGQLIVDNEHNTSDQNCAFEDHGEECWRGSAWELHPVTSLFVCVTAQPCTTDSANGWTPFEALKQ